MGFSVPRTGAATQAARGHSSHIAALRGLAILSVVQSHYLALTNTYGYMGAPQFLNDALSAGGGGVQLFFVLSAFLLTRSLLRERESPGVVFSFYKRRAARIIPAYWLLLALGFALPHVFARENAYTHWLWDHTQPLAVYLAFVQNWVGVFAEPQQAKIFGPTWSLAVEEQFYLLIPVAVVLMSRRNLTFLAMAAVALGHPMRLAIHAEAGGVAAYFWPLAHVDAFGWGVLIAILAVERPDVVKRVSAPLLACIAIASFIALGGLLHGRIHSDPRLYALYFTLVNLTGAALALAALSDRVPAWVEGSLTHRCLAWCGERCYSLYLFHNPFFGLGMMAACVGFGVTDLSLLLLSVILTFLALLAFADFTYRFVERPFIELAARRPADAGTPGQVAPTVPEPLLAGGGGAELPVVRQTA